MKTNIAIIAAAAASLAAFSPAVAEPLAPKPVTEAAAQDGAAAAAVKPRAQRYCFVDKVTGSNVPRRECRTREEWSRRNVEVPANL